VSTTTTHPTKAPRLGALLRSEVLRARSRRSLLWLPLVALLAVLAVAALLWFTSGYVTAADLEAAKEQFRTEQMQYYEQCMADPGIPEADREFACWKPTEEDIAANAVWALDRDPFDTRDLTGLLNLAGGFGLLVALLLAATTGGADWGARTMGLLLSWEPRRTRVFAVRLAVVVSIGLAVAALLVLLALGLGAVIAAAHGVDPDAAATLPDDLQPPDLSDGLELALRWLPLAALGAAGSFAMAMLTRSTGWAIGASIGFVAIVESVVQGVWAWGSQWLIQTNVIAWLQGGTTWLVDRRAAMQGSGGYGEPGLGDGEPSLAPGYILISDTRALATLAGVVLVAALISWALFRRRDVE
jgi:ABC-2 type transport system permease protein